MICSMYVPEMIPGFVDVRLTSGKDDVDPADWLQNCQIVEMLNAYICKLHHYNVGPIFKLAKFINCLIIPPSYLYM